MKRAPVAFIVALLALTASSLQGAGRVVVRGGWLFQAQEQKFVPNPGIVVVAGRFFQVGPRLSREDLQGARLVDLGADDYILPGLIDLHAHYNLNLFGRRRREEVNVYPAIFLANGVTTTFPAGEYNPTRMLQVRKRIDSGHQPGPRIFNSGPYFGRARPGWREKMSPAQIEHEVDFWAALGVRGFKAKRIQEEELRVLIERAHLHGLTVTGHLGSGYQGSVNPREAIRMGIDRIEHFLGGDALPADRPAYASLVSVEVNTPEFRRITELYLSHHVYFDATVSAYGYFGTRRRGYDYWVDERRFFTPYVRQQVRSRGPRKINQQFERIYQVKQKTVKAFYDAGGWITLGTDHASTGEFLSGFAAHREIETLVRSGIPAAAVLRIATLNGARALGVGDLLGSIETGKLADLFVVRGNPLQEIRNTRRVKLVMKSGRLYHPAELLASARGKMGPRDAKEAELW